MKMPSIDERSKAAEALRYVARCGCELTDGEMLDELYSIAMSRGFWEPESKDRDSAFLNRLADLIDPTEHERTVADNLKIIDRNRELEIELAALKAKLGNVSRLAERLRGDARMAVVRSGDRPIPQSAADRFEIAAEIAEAIR